MTLIRTVLLFTSIIILFMGHFGASFVLVMVWWFTGWIAKHLHNSLPHDYFDALDEINTQDADLDS